MNLISWTGQEFQEADLLILLVPVDCRQSHSPVDCWKRQGSGSTGNG